MKNEIVAHNDLKIRIEDNFFNPIDSDELLTKLISKLPWESMVIKMCESGDLFPPKTTKHTTIFDLPPILVSLDDLK